MLQHKNINNSSAFGNEVTPANIINLVYNIFQKTGKYRSALEKWNEKQDNDKTWYNFKNHFRQAHKTQKEFANKTTGSTGYTNLMTDNTTSTQVETAEEFMKNVAEVISSNQQLLPQLFESINIMNDNVTKLQNDFKTMNNVTTNNNKNKNNSKDNNNNKKTQNKYHIHHFINQLLT